MARTRTPGRLEHILEAGAQLFIAKGYRLTRIADVAAQADVAPATVHLYTATKPSLFDLAMRRELRDPTVRDETLPYHAPSPRACVDRIWQRLLANADFPVLRSITHVVPPQGADAELRDIAREAYRWLGDHRRAIMIIERCADDWPELASLFALQFRREFLNRLTAFIDRRARQGVLRRTPDAAIAARVVLESITYFAVRRHETLENSMNVALAEEVVLDMIGAALHPA